MYRNIRWKLSVFGDVNSWVVIMDKFLFPVGMFGIDSLIKVVFAVLVQMEKYFLLVLVSFSVKTFLRLWGVLIHLFFASRFSFSDNLFLFYFFEHHFVVGLVGFNIFDWGVWLVFLVACFDALRFRVEFIGELVLLFALTNRSAFATSAWSWAPAVILREMLSLRFRARCGSLVTSSSIFYLSSLFFIAVWLMGIFPDWSIHLKTRSSLCGRAVWLLCRHRLFYCCRWWRCGCLFGFFGWHFASCI